MKLKLSWVLLFVILIPALTSCDFLDLLTGASDSEKDGPKLEDTVWEVLSYASTDYETEIYPQDRVFNKYDEQSGLLTASTTATEYFYLYFSNNKMYSFEKYLKDDSITDQEFLNISGYSPNTIYLEATGIYSLEDGTNNIFFSSSDFNGYFEFEDENIVITVEHFGDQDIIQAKPSTEHSHDEIVSLYP